MLQLSKMSEKIVDDLFLENELLQKIIQKSDLEKAKLQERIASLEDKLLLEKSKAVEVKKTPTNEKTVSSFNILCLDRKPLVTKDDSFSFVRAKSLLSPFESVCQKVERSTQTESEESLNIPQKFELAVKTLISSAPVELDSQGLNSLVKKIFSLSDISIHSISKHQGNDLIDTLNLLEEEKQKLKNEINCLKLDIIGTQKENDQNRKLILFNWKKLKLGNSNVKNVTGIGKGLKEPIDIQIIQKFAFNRHRESY